MRPSISINEVKGTGGELRIANRVAASLASWSVMAGEVPNTWAFAAQIGTENTWLMSQRPNVIVLPFGKGQIRWRSVTLESGDGRVRGTLHGAPEEL